MKRLLFVLGTALLLTGCGKDGSIGPQGPQGPEGAQGVQGVKGEKGEDGSTIYSGAAAPPANVGQVGDFYFRTSNSDFFGPKTESGWGTATNLRGATGATGATGAAGAAGSKILSGTAVPAAGLGAVGDFYFRTSNADFYGPKTASGWGTAISVRGIPGKDGAVILTGTGAPNANLGAVGDMYLDRNTSNLYGPKILAVVGGNGWGTPHSLKGETGAAGAAGSRIHSGTANPAVSLGTIGDYYLNRTTGDFYGPKMLITGGSSSWGTPINLRGTANVVSSNWFGLKPAWDISWGDDTRRQYFTVPQPMLNAVNATTLNSFMNSGGIFLMYMDHTVATFGVTQLPYSANYVDFGWMTSRYTNLSEENYFYFTINAHSGETIPASYRTPSNITLRYVMIPAGRVLNGVASVNGRRIAVDQLKAMSYEQAGATFGWEE